MPDIDYMELFENPEQFGAPGAEPGKEPETEDPMGGAEEEQEGGDPAEVPEEEQEDTEPDDPAQGAPEGAKRVQSREENARYAAARRDAERERDEAIANHQKRTDATIAALGMKNPYDGTPIKTVEDLERYQTEHNNQQQRTVAQKAGMTDAEFAEFVEGLPQVRQANAAARAAREAQAQQRINAELAEIARLNPEIKSLADLTAMPDYEKFYGMVNRGLSLSEAYKLMIFDGRQTKGQQSAAAQRQAAINEAGKHHLTASRMRGAGAETVPAEVAAEYRKMIPGITDKQIAAHYRKTIKEGK